MPALNSTLSQTGTTSTRLEQVTTDQVAFTGGTMTGVDIIALAGTATKAGLHLPTGVLKTTPVAGDIEYDGVVPYIVPVASERGVLDSQQIITMQGGTYTLTSRPRRRYSIARPMAP